ncbi:MAG: long-chain fatty acid--CoA ligase [Desulfuromonadales bacterium]|nr:MAG: long-chain fatty acid--CoA ligase [Desulfuromonadales bacterium]
MFNLIDIFLKIVEAQPEHTAVAGPGNDEELNYRQLAERIDALACELYDAGIRPGHCVGLHYPSGKNYIVINYALWRCGACVVPIPVEYVPDEKKRIFSDICLNFVVSKVGIYSVVAPHCSESPNRLSDDVVVASVESHKEHPPGFFEINPAFLRFTSGTTGASKGVLLSHETIFERIHAANDALRIGPDDRIIWLLSMSHHFAVSIVAYLSFGATIVLCRDHFGRTIIETTAMRSGTIIYGSPIHYELMANDRSSLQLPSLRLAISTTTSLRNEVAESFHARFGKSLSQAYGIIEIGLPCINIDAPQNKFGSVGRLLPAYEICMDDVGMGEELKAIRLRGKGVFDAYYCPWQTRNELLEDGWFSTGDLGMLDEDGYLYIKGRMKEVVNIAGMKFFPQEVEQVLLSHPDVEDACVYSHKHEWRGEVPYARVVAKNGIKQQLAEKELKIYCSKFLSAYKVPDKILFVQILSRTASGKLIRDEARMNVGKE